MFRYEINIVVCHVSSDQKSHIHMTNYISPVQYCNGDVISIGSECCTVTDLVWILSHPGTAFFTIKPDFVVRNDAEAQRWFAKISGKMQRSQKVQHQ